MSHLDKINKFNELEKKVGNKNAIDIMMASCFPFLETFCSGMEWMDCLFRAVFSIWKDLGTPETFQFPVSEVTFLTKLAEYTDEDGKFMIGPDDYEGYWDNVNHHFKNSLFDLQIKDDGKQGIVTYQPLLKLNVTKEMTLEANLARMLEWKERKCIAAGKICFSHDAKDGLRFYFLPTVQESSEGWEEFFDTTAVIGKFQEGQKWFFGKFRHGTNKPYLHSAKFFEYSEKGISEFLEIVQREDCCIEANLMTVYSKNGQYAVRDTADFNQVKGKRYYCVIDMTDREISFFPDAVQKILREKRNRDFHLDDSQMAMKYLQFMLDEHFQEIQTATAGMICPEFEKFHGYCRFVSHPSLLGKDGDIVLDWHDLPKEQIPAAWTKLQKLVSCSEYPLEMWQDII